MALADQDFAFKRPMVDDLAGLQQVAANSQWNTKRNQQLEKIGASYNPPPLKIQPAKPQPAKDE
jgi:hypothetical protein